MQWFGGHHAESSTTSTPTARPASEHALEEVGQNLFSASLGLFSNGDMLRLTLRLRLHGAPVGRVAVLKSEAVLERRVHIQLLLC